MSHGSVPVIVTTVSDRAASHECLPVRVLRRGHGRPARSRRRKAPAGGQAIIMACPGGGPEAAVTSFKSVAHDTVPRLRFELEHSSSTHAAARPGRRGAATDR